MEKIVNAFDLFCLVKTARNEKGNQGIYRTDIYLSYIHHPIER